MKRNPILVGLAVAGALTLVGCSQSSPTAPKQPTPTAFGISLTASPSVAGINESIMVVALVTIGSGNAPDGTTVTFSATGSAYFLSSSGAHVQQVIATTTSGAARVIVYTQGPGDFLITASVPNKSASVTLHFRGVSTGQLAITSVLPNRGKPQGGDQVVISGQGFLQPLTVNFIIGATAYAATVVSVAADGSSITALTPQVPATAGDQVASVQVTLTGVVAPGGGAVSATLANAFTFGADSGAPQLFSVVPNSGLASGGETITLTGKNFTEPLQVSFVFPNATVPGVVVSVQHGADGFDIAHVVTPKVTITATTTVDIMITNSVGSASSKSATFLRAFTFILRTSGPPVIFYISPTYGSAQGHETVLIYGQNFVTGATVTIGPTPEMVVSVSEDGTVITIMTNPVGGVVPTTPQDVTVTTTAGTATLSQAFTYLEGATPQLFTLSPNLGPTEGGTRVTITGAGFQYPVQVLFGALQAVVVTTNFNQVVCISPSITPQQPGTPFTVQVQVTNTTSGKASNTLPFQYGQAMFISNIVPSQGPADAPTTVSIQGQGFVAPVRITVTGVSGVTSWNPTSVSGTEIVATTTPLPRGSCQNVQAGVTVTNIDSNITSNSASFTYQGTQPLISSVEIDSTGTNVVQQYQPAGSVICNTPWTSHTATIHGSGFQQTGGASAMTVSIGSLPPVPTTFIDANTVRFTLPDLTSIGLNQIACTPAGGGCGNQFIATPVGVSVTNLRSGCGDNLPGAIVINPCDNSCRPTTITSLTLVGPAGTQTVGTPFLVTVNIAPAQTTPTAITLTCNPAFTCPAVSIPPTVTSFPVSVTPVGAVANGQIFGTAGSGNCQVASNVLSVSAQAALAVTVVLNGGATGSVTSSPAGININTATTQTFNFTTSPVVLTAAPVTGSFGGWSGGATCPCSDTALTCNVAMNAAKACTATFNNP